MGTYLRLFVIQLALPRSSRGSLSDALDAGSHLPQVLLFVQTRLVPIRAIDTRKIVQHPALDRVQHLRWHEPRVASRGSLPGDRAQRRRVGQPSLDTGRERRQPAWLASQEVGEMRQGVLEARVCALEGGCLNLL
ncbi:hypothetical protein C8Q73DRAFT_293895 [Cubamyces lactineus]|nr:hypothetical protein C8Q73DRAFT_293895 [Cubamyces lactineus]